MVLTLNTRVRPRCAPAKGHDAAISEVGHQGEVAMKTFGKMILAFGAVALMAAPSWAQGQGRGFGMGGGGGALLSNKSVQQELKVTDEQAKKLDAFGQDLMAKNRERFQGLQDLSADERRAKMQDLNKTMTAEIKKGLADILKPEQAKRFEQIQLQTMGYNAFNMPNVQESLKLTAEQKTKFTELGTATGTEMREIMQSAGDDREAAMKKATELRKSATDKAMAVLTADQKTTWKEMTGTPFEVKFEPRPPQN
jgi:Spy/CpxP family protein refolding chaperone